MTVVSAEQNAAELASEVQGLVERELVRIGVHGVLHRDGELLILRRAGAETSAELRGTLLQWDSLPDDLRERRIQQIAKLLATVVPEVRPVQAGHAAEAAKDALGRRWYSSFAPLAIVAATAGAIVTAYHFLAPRSGAFTIGSAAPSLSAGIAAANSSDSDHERFFLASNACAHTRTRVLQGGNIGPADSEGWVVELALLKSGASSDLAQLPALAKFIARKPGARTGTLIWPQAAQLVAQQRFDAEVTLSPIAPLGESRLSGIDLVFSGPYVLPYFTEDQRREYFQLADALAGELGASQGALFARCASGDSHQIGSWFLGATPGDAIASLVYFMAAYSDAPALKPNVLGAISGPPNRAHAFDVIRAAAAKVDRGTAATWLGGELGVVTTGSDRATRLTFPFRDAGRAARASVVAARALSLANSG
ncbi:MAG TPA: hypothetical protein VHV51_09145 [Polyangiaceae bacterium]|nr:hypothetical protein [Polyangiaceae bacterium]